MIPRSPITHLVPREPQSPPVALCGERNPLWSTTVPRFCTCQHCLEADRQRAQAQATGAAA